MESMLRTDDKIGKTMGGRREEDGSAGTLQREQEPAMDEGERCQKPIAGGKKKEKVTVLAPRLVGNVEIFLRLRTEQRSSKQNT